MASPRPHDPRTSLSRLALAVPPLPGTLVGVTELLDRPTSVDVDHVTRLVRHDPIVVARLLKIANSAHYGLQRTVQSADRAVDLLGPVTVAGIVAGMGLMRLKSALEGPAAGPFMRLVRHSMATARIARAIMRSTGAGTDRIEAAFTAGLLHDLGRILLVYHEPVQSVALYERADLVLPVDTDDARDIEQLTFGYDHTEAGEYVARTLDFPELLVDAIRYHHEPAVIPSRSGHQDILASVICADRAASALGFAFDRARAWDDLKGDLAQLPLPGVDGDGLFRTIESEIADVEQVVEALTRLPDPSPSGLPGTDSPGAMTPSVHEHRRPLVRRRRIPVRTSKKGL